MGMLTGRRIGLLTASASRLGGGVFEAVAAQAGMIREAGGEACVFTIADRHTDDDRARFAPSPVVACPLQGPAQVGYAPQLVEQMIAANCDLLHLHGIWMYPSLAGTVWARRTGRPYIVSPHGMLDPWITARGRWKKAVARLGYERASWRQASVLHALTGREAGDIRRESGRRDALVIPNAGPVAKALSVEGRAPHVVYIGRIHPKKNLLPLVAAWGAARLPAGARLTIAGWGEEAHVAQLRAALEGAPETVSFVGPVYGADKAALLADARFMILPSLSEGLPMAILESWAHGAPTIMTEQCNLPEGFAAGAALPCGFDAGAIVPALEAALGTDDAAWQVASQAALRLAEGVFSPGAVKDRWADAYLRLIAQGRGA